MFLKDVSHYDLSVLSMSVLGLKKWMGVSGWSELYPVFVWIFEKKINIAKPIISSLKKGSMFTIFLNNHPPFENMVYDMNKLSLHLYFASNSELFSSAGDNAIGSGYFLPKCGNGWTATRMYVHYTFIYDLANL